jgi:FHA domain
MASRRMMTQNPLEHVPAEPSFEQALLPAAPSALLSFDNGRTVTVWQVVLIGRAPLARADEDYVMPYAIEDGTMTVSKTHLAVGVDDFGPWIEDRHSSNGVSTVSSHGVHEQIPVGQLVRVQRGQRVQFGDRWMVVG